ncbi:MAG: glycosyltransferase family 2 protein [Gemmatimonadetes bacterium]|nr:glycosyltransferase family 2 protein [Gemmatimonadota bacterium]
MNEEGNVGRAIERIHDVMTDFPYEYEIIVIDDASADGTAREVEVYSARYPEHPVRLVRNRFCRGLGRNYFIAAQRARGEYFMLVNGDAAEPAEALRTILEHLGEADAIVPYFGLNETRTPPRRMLSYLFTQLVNVLSGHRLHYYNGPVLHKTENVRLWFAETAGFGYQAELLCRLLDEGITVKEVQIPNSDRERGASKAFTVRNLLSVANTLFHVFLRRLERLAFRILTPGIRRRGSAAQRAT